MSFYRISEPEITQFKNDGYIIVDNFLSPEEVKVLVAVSKSNDELLADAGDRLDKKGKMARLTIRNTLSNDMFSAIVRSRRMVGTMETLLEGEVYHYHHKMTMKEPKIGGAWEWHQDYGYWYNNGCLYPYMASCYIAVDKATKENGCMQLLKGSHHMGRLEHGIVAGQTGADVERVEQAKKCQELIYAEMEPGAALFFHSNTLHRSDDNTSDTARWGLICCYNAARNDPYRKHGHPNYSPLEILEDERVLEVGLVEMKLSGLS